MSAKRIIGIIIVILGIGSIIVSKHIAHRVEEGKSQATQAQGQVDQGKALFDIDPVTKEVGEGLAASAQERIDRGWEEIAHYSKLSQLLNIGGIAAIVVGGLLIIFGKKH